MLILGTYIFLFIFLTGRSFFPIILIHGDSDSVCVGTN